MQQNLRTGLGNLFNSKESRKRPLIEAVLLKKSDRLYSLWKIG